MMSSKPLDNLSFSKKEPPPPKKKQTKKTTKKNRTKDLTDIFIRGHRRLLYCIQKSSTKIRTLG